MSAIHGLRRVVLGRFVVLRHDFPMRVSPQRPAVAVGEDECGAGFDLHRGVVPHVPVQFSKQRPIDRNRSDTGRGLGRS